MTRRVIVVFCAIGCMLLMPLCAFAQQVDLETPPRERSQPRPLERDLYPHQLPVPNAPVFLAPLSKMTKTGRAGVAGWTTPNTAVGPRRAGDPDSAGWFGFGFAAEWGGSNQRPN